MHADLKGSVGTMYGLENGTGNIRGFPKTWGTILYLFGGPHNKARSILGSILGSPYFGKLPPTPLNAKAFNPKL